MWRYTRPLLLAFAVIGIGAAAAQAPTADPAALVSRIEFLERQVRILGDRMRVPAAAPGAEAAAGAEATGPATARLSVRITELEQELRAITGRIEELGFQVRRLNERFDRLAADAEYRAGQPSVARAAPPPAGAAIATTPPAAPPVAPVSPPAGAPPPAAVGGPRVLGALPTGEAERPPPPPARTEEAPAPAVEVPAAAVAGVAPPGPQASSREHYAFAFSLMQRQQYKQSEEAFQDFLRRFPGDPLAENASYWLGESYYAQGDYTRAATTFLETYEKHKTGAKAPDTLLKLGMSLGQLKKTKEACATFQELARAFPAAPSSIKSRANEERRRLGCP